MHALRRDGFDVLANRPRREYAFPAHVPSLEVFGGLPCESESVDGPLQMRSVCGVLTLTPGLGPVNASPPYTRKDEPRMRENRWLSTGLLTAGLLAGIAAHAAAADEQFLLTQQETGVRSFFTLDFGPFGQTEGEVSNTRFLLKLDRTNNTAEFLKYRQDIDSLTLPGGFETGDIIVTVVPGSSAGVFDPATGEFKTQEEYLIFFEGDLSKFGIVSPISLPSTSRGTVTFDTPRNGGVVQTWEGEGILQNPLTRTNRSCLPIPARLDRCTIRSIAAT